MNGTGYYVGGDKNTEWIASNTTADELGVADDAARGDA